MSTCFQEVFISTCNIKDVLILSYVTLFLCASCIPNIKAYFLISYKLWCFFLNIDVLTTCFVIKTVEIKEEKKYH